MERMDKESKGKSCAGETMNLVFAIRTRTICTPHADFDKCMQTT